MHWLMTSKRGLCWVFMSHRAAQNTISESAPSNHILSGKDCQSYFSGHRDWSKMDLAGDAAGASLTCTWGRSEVPWSQLMLPEQPTTEGQQLVHRYSSFHTPQWVCIKAGTRHQMKSLKNSVIKVNRAWLQSLKKIKLMQTFQDVQNIKKN